MNSPTPITDSMFPSSDQFYVETVTERGPGNTVFASTIRPATIQDVHAAEEQHRLGKCAHSVVHDEHGWMYDFRSCAICGAALGAV